MVIFGGLLVFLTVLLFPTLRNYLSQRDQIESLNSQVSQQRKDYDALQKQRARWDDPTYVQQQARERLGFAKPGEKAYIVVDDTGKKQNAQAEGVEGVQKAPAAASRAWYGQIWGSAVSAGQQDSDGTDSTK
ncbi:FtsB family cell division protein [Dermacoccaceae bacterium W4C1]